MADETGVPARILIVDDEDGIRDVLGMVLAAEGYLVKAASDGYAALAFMKQEPFDLVISDMKMPRMGGLELLASIVGEFTHTLVLMITAFSSTSDAVEAMKLGAFDYLTKPFKNDEIKVVVKRAIETVRLRRENRELKTRLERRTKFGGMVGESNVMQQLFGLIEKVAPTHASVVIMGESGTGKELVAREIHKRSGVSSSPFLAVNCAAIPEALLESELFGHERGAFTGATSARTGLFESAGDGTVFLDEIGEMPLSMQVKLLRVLQEREVVRVGGTKTVPVAARIVVATNRDLEKEVSEGRFREDLYYRLNVMTLQLPALRDRKEDIPLLLSSVIATKCPTEPFPSFSPDAMRILIDYHWPGNVRELINVVERALILSGGGRWRLMFYRCLCDKKSVVRTWPLAVGVWRKDSCSMTTSQVLSARFSSEHFMKGGGRRRPLHFWG